MLDNNVLRIFANDVPAVSHINRLFAMFCLCSRRKQFASHRG